MASNSNFKPQIHLLKLKSALHRHGMVLADLIPLDGTWGLEE